MMRAQGSDSWAFSFGGDFYFCWRIQLVVEDADRGDAGRTDFGGVVEGKLF